MAEALAPRWLAARRQDAAARAANLELPSFKGTPGWEFTDLSGLDIESYLPAAPGAARVRPHTPLFDGLDAALRLVQVDATPLESPQSSVVMPLDAAADSEVVERHLGTLVPGDDPFVARNDAAWSGGALVHVPAGERLEGPILLSAIQAEAGTQLPWRVLIVLEEGAEAEVWEQYSSDVDGVFNAVVEIVVGRGARLRFVSGQTLSDKAWLFGTQRAVVESDGALEWVALGFGSGRGKVRMETNLGGAGAEAKVTGAYAGTGRQHLDFDTAQEHAAPNTTSDLAFRGVLSGRSSSVWRGMIRVDPGAQRTDAFQESRNLLLSKRAHADAIPGLEIEANDVRCTHAAAVAQIDPEQVFYLMTRGVPRPLATRLVIEGFMEELVERFAAGPVRAVLAAALERRLERVLGA